MIKQFIAGKKYRVITEGMRAAHYFNVGDIVTAEESSTETRPRLAWATDGFTSNVLCVDDVEELPEEKQLPDEKQLPKWGDLLPQERHQLLGEIVDAMIYNGRAVMQVQELVNKFKTAGYVRSVILPIENPETE